MLTGRLRVTVDIGGTFTDLHVLEEGTGRQVSFKGPTTPEDPSAGLMQAVRGAAERHGFDLAQVATLIHGTTIATNAVLEHKLPAGALVTIRNTSGDKPSGTERLACPHEWRRLQPGSYEVRGQSGDGLVAKEPVAVSAGQTAECSAGHQQVTGWQPQVIDVQHKQQWL